MKLFQKMLVATAAVSFIAPLAAQASDVINLDGMNNYSRSNKKANRIDSNTFINKTNEDIAVLKGRVDGLEARQENFEAGSFSDTTTLDGKAVFAIGAADHTTAAGDNGAAAGPLKEGVYAAYTYTMNLNSSFTGDDNLYIRIKTGNGAGWARGPR